MIERNVDGYAGERTAIETGSPAQILEKVFRTSFLRCRLRGRGSGGNRGKENNKN
jgi:hypothetical protein